MISKREAINNSDLIFHIGEDMYQEKRIALSKQCFGSGMSDLIDQSFLQGKILII